MAAKDSSKVIMVLDDVIDVMCDVVELCYQVTGWAAISAMYNITTNENFKETLCMMEIPVT